jgi:ribosomal protein L25 (general stress protein Ctc)
MIKIIEYHNNVIESPFVPINYAFISTENASIIPPEYKFIAIHSTSYTVIRTDKIKDAYIHTNGPIIGVNPIQTIVAFNVSVIATQIGIEITSTTSSQEIEMQQATNEIYLALNSLCLVHRQVFETAHFKCMVIAPTYTSYFVANKTTKLDITVTGSKYKLYTSVQNVANQCVIYCDAKMTGPSTQRYTILNVEEIKRNALFKLNPVYVGKHLLLESNKTMFDIEITHLSCPLLHNSICFLSNYEFSFVSSDPNMVIYSPSTIHSPTFFEIELLEIKTKYNTNKITSTNINVYKMSDITDSILQLFSIPTIVKVNDTYEILVDNTILQIKIKTIYTALSKSASICYYNPPLNIVLGVCSNYQKHIYVMTEPAVANVKLCEVQIKCNVELDHIAITKAIRERQNIMSTNLGKPIQLTIADSKIEAIITNVQTDSGVITNTLLHINEQTQFDLDIECEPIQSHISLSREDLKNIKPQLESYGMSGMDEQIRILTKELFLPRTNFMPKGLVNILRPTKGVILYGPPGTGKTTLARNIGSLLHIPAEEVKMITATEILNKFIGESEENIRGLFEPARKNPNKVHLLIIDEMDAILGSRKGQTELRNSIVNQFLGEMDGLNQVSNILIIGITNRLDMLDSAVLRPGRFSCLIKCDLPNIHSRKQIIQLYINKLQASEIAMDEIDLHEMAEKTDGFSCADIEYIFNCLIDKLAEHLFETECVMNISKQHMLDVIHQIKHRTQPI